MIAGSAVSRPRLHGVPCSIILHYVKSGFGGPPYLWRTLHAAQYRAGKRASQALQVPLATVNRPVLTRTHHKARAHCYSRENHQPQPISQPSRQARSTAPSCSSSRAGTLFAKKRAKSAYQPSASARRRFRINRRSPKSGKAPCRSTGKANVNVIARLRRALASGFVTLLAGEKGKHPAKALPPSITAIYPVCHAACKKNSKRHDRPGISL